MAFEHQIPVAVLVMIVGKMLEKLHQRPVGKLQIGKNTVQDPGKILTVLPELVVRQQTLVAHVMLNFMPALEKHGTELDLEGGIDRKLPKLAGIQLKMLGWKLEYTVYFGGAELCRIKIISGPGAGAQKGVLHDLSADA